MTESELFLALTDDPNNIELKKKYRNILLNQSDWTQSSDSPLDNATKAAWAAYRQELRDLPAQEGFPNVAFPLNPTGNAAINDFPEEL